jgi:hypothetical protein
VGILNRIFGSSVSVADEARLTSEELVKAWKKYLATFEEEQKEAQSPSVSYQKLQKLNETELVEVDKEKIDEKRILKDLSRLSHDDKIEKIHRLQYSLDYDGKEALYLFKLFEQLFDIIHKKAYLLEKMADFNSDLVKRAASNVFSHLKSQREIQKELNTKIDTFIVKHGEMVFSRLFVELANKERVIEELDKKEKRVFSMMEKKFKISEDFPESVTDKWIVAVQEGLQQKVHDAFYDYTLTGKFPEFADFEFVHSDNFVKFVRATIAHIREKPVSENMINLFVYTFRDAYSEIKLKIMD